MKRGKQGEGGGRPIAKLEDDQILQVEKLAAVLSKNQIASFFGISANTFRAIEQRQPEVFEAYQKGKAKAIASVATNLISQAQAGNVTAAIFYLETQAGWKEQSGIEIAVAQANFEDLNMYRQGSEEEARAIIDLNENQFQVVNDFANQILNVIHDDDD